MKKRVVFLELAGRKLEKEVGREEVPKYYIGTSLIASVIFSVKNII